MTILWVALSATVLSAQIITTSQLDPAIYQTEVDGRNPSTLDLETLLKGESYRPLGITISENRLLWTDLELDAIYTINLDGTDFRTLVDLDRHLGDGDHSPHGLVQMGRRIYWTDGNRDGIYTAGLDGSNPRRLIDLGSRFGASGYANGITATRTQIYWTNWAAGMEGIYTADLDGNNPRKLIGFPRSSAFPRDITATSSRLFWTDGGGRDGRGKIYTAKLDGGDPRVLIELDAVLGIEEPDPRGIAVSGPLVYWSEYHTKGIYAARLDGTNTVRLSTLPTFAGFLAVRSEESPESLAITDLRTTPSSSPFLRTWRLTWNSEIAERYRVLLSDDLERWAPVDGTWLADRLQTESEILLPASMRRAFFKIEKQ